MNISGRPTEFEPGNRSCQGCKFSMHTGSLGIIPIRLIKGSECEDDFDGKVGIVGLIAFEYFKIFREAQKYPEIISIALLNLSSILEEQNKNMLKLLVNTEVLR